MRNYWLKNPDKYKHHLEVVSKKNKTNPAYKEYQKEYHKQYKLLNSDDIKIYASKYRLENHIILWYRKIRTRAKKRGIVFSIEEKDFIDFINKQSDICCYCLKKFGSDDKNKYPSIDRMNNNQGYTINNIKICCYRCNVVKNNYFSYDEMLLLGRTINEIETKRLTTPL